ncbi:MAG: glycosyltransferase family 39 protein, partial [Planctomycetes bacterium]|nr:glycosyltransferase family 39 protein [Planctomycetota bacterium]
MTAIRGLTFLLPVCLTLFFVDLNGLDLWSSHEARAAQNAQRMLDDRDWLLPRLYDGQPDFQKPPAFYWLVAGIGSCRNDTVDRWAVRLPSAIAALATVLMVWLRLVRHGRPLAGLIAGLILATSVHFTALARTGRIDMPLTATVTAAILMLSTTGPRFIATLGAGFALAGAILLKGPIGVVLALGVVSLTLIARRIRGERLEIRMILPPLGAMLLGSLIALPWFHEVNERTSGEFMRIFFWHHNVERALGNAPSLATHPWWYYLPRFGVDFLPWTPMLLAAMYLTVRG